MGKVGLGRLGLLQLGDLVCRSDAISTRSPPFPTSPLYPVPSFGSSCAQGSDPTRTWSFSLVCSESCHLNRFFPGHGSFVNAGFEGPAGSSVRALAGLVVFVFLSFPGGLLAPF